MFVVTQALRFFLINFRKYESVDNSTGSSCLIHHVSVELVSQTAEEAIAMES